VIFAFWWIFDSVVRVEISPGLQSFWTSLRLFVKENYLRSRRASCATTKNEKSEIHNIRSQMAQNTRVQRVKWHICDVWSYDESKDFAQVSDCLSRKIIWDPAEFDKSQIVCQGKLSEIPQSILCYNEKWKVRNTQYYVWNETKYTNAACRMTYLWFMVLWWEQRFCRAGNFFDNSQIVCQGKLSEILQSTLRWHEKWKVRNTQY